MGDHAAVYRRPAVVATVGLMTEVIVRSGPRGRVSAELVNLEGEWSWESEVITERTRTAGDLWRSYADSPDADRLAQLLRAGDAERLAVLAVGEAARAAQREPADIHLSLFSELPMGAGMGSSASVATAIVAALAAYWNQDWSPDELARVVLEVERRQHGFPSGIDHQTVIRGGVVWARPGGERGQVELEVLDCGAWPQPVIIDTGAPNQTTAEVVEEVRRAVGGDDFEGWDSMHAATRAFRTALGAGTDPRPAVRDYQRHLERLGVVPPRIIDWVRSWEDIGGAAKISGAGATRGEQAGCLLAYPPTGYEGSVESVLPAGWIARTVTIGGHGLMVDRA